jgi:hypothetical protein
MFVIEDEAHAERLGEFSTIEAATAELRRLSKVSWDEAPNVAPCTNWRACGRRYELVHYDSTNVPWREKLRIPALNVSAKAVVWLLP